jgi:glutamate synthase domain-containing protein 3
LENWDKFLTQFVKVYPIDYCRVVEEQRMAALKKEKTLVVGPIEGEDEAPSDG